MGSRYAALVLCEVCDEPLTLGGQVHCPRGDCGAGPRCSAHACLCGSPDALAEVCAECSPAHERGSHCDGSTPGDYAGECDESGCACTGFRADAVAVAS